MTALSEVQDYLGTLPQYCSLGRGLQSPCGEQTGRKEMAFRAGSTGGLSYIHDADCVSLPRVVKAGVLSELGYIFTPCVHFLCAIF